MKPSSSAGRPDAGSTVQLSEDECRSGALIGVCGPTGAGKTVFQTCIFQTLDNNIPGQGWVSFDRQDKTGAVYFGEQEREIRARGECRGTMQGRLTRLQLKMPGPLLEGGSSYLPIYLFDFAGRHFNELADLKEMAAHEESPEVRQRFLQVQSFLENCDAIFLLISSQPFKPRQEASSDDPFPKSMSYVMQLCAENRIPLALIFTQHDRNPSLSADTVETFPFVDKFRKLFTSNYQESQRNGKPFGFVNLLTCYEAEPGKPPRQQNSGDGIWRPEPARAFVSLLRAAFPGIRGKILDHAELKKARTIRKRVIWAATGILALALLGASYFVLRGYLEDRDVDFIRSVAESVARGACGQVSADDRERLRRLSAGPGGQAELRDPFNSLWQSLSAVAGQGLSAASLEQKAADHLECLIALADSLAPNRPQTWGDSLVPALSARAGFIKDWLAIPSDHHAEHLRLLNDRSREWGEDSDFRQLLQEKAAQARESFARGWDQTILRDNAVVPRFNRIQSLVGEIDEQMRQDSLQADAGLKLAVRQNLAAWMVDSILTLEENVIVREALKRMLPGVAGLDAKRLPFRLLYDEFKRPDEAADFQRLRNQIDGLQQALRESRKGRDFLNRTLLAALLQGLSWQQRRAFWQRTAAEIESRYLFNASGEASLIGVSPLPKQIASQPDVPRMSQAFIESVIENSVYYQELEVLSALINARYLRLQTIGTYKSLRALTGAARSGLPRPVPIGRLDGLLEEIPALRPPDRPYLKQTREYFASQELELRERRKAVENYNLRVDLGAEPAKWLDYLDRSWQSLLKHHCGEMLKLDTGECADVH